LSLVFPNIAFRKGPLITGLGAGYDYRVGIGMALAVILLQGIVLGWLLLRANPGEARG